MRPSNVTSRKEPQSIAKSIKRAKSANSSSIYTGRRTSRSIFDRLKNEKTQPIKNRSLVPKKDTKFSTKTNKFTMNYNVPASNAPKREPASKMLYAASLNKNLSSFYHLIKRKSSNPTIYLKENRVLAKKPSGKNPASLRNMITPSSIFGKCKSSEYQVPLQNSRLADLVVNNNSSSSCAWNSPKHVFGFYNVITNQSVRCSYEELNSPFIKDKNLDELDTQSPAKKAHLELRDTTKISNNTKNTSCTNTKPKRLKIDINGEKSIRNIEKSGNIKVKEKSTTKRLLKIGSQKNCSYQKK